MSDWMRKVWKANAPRASGSGSFPFPKRLKLLEKLRDRSLAIARSPLRKGRRIEG